MAVSHSIVFTIFLLILLAGLAGGFVYLLYLLIRCLRLYLKTGEARKEQQAVCKSLGETLKLQREQRHMTQEFVAERLGVSRQAVSKWETGASDPSTSNLLALAKLYGIDAAELLNQLP